MPVVKSRRAGHRGIGRLYRFTHSALRIYFAAISYLNMVIEFSSCFNKGRTDRGPVNSCIGTYFHVVVYHYISNLWYLCKTSIRLWCKSETVPSNNDSCMNRYVFSYYTIMMNFYAGI